MLVLILHRWDEGDINAELISDLGKFSTNCDSEAEVLKDLGSYLRERAAAEELLLNDGTQLIELAKLVENNKVPTKLYREPKHGTAEETWMETDRMQFDEIGEIAKEERIKFRQQWLEEMKELKD